MIVFEEARSRGFAGRDMRSISPYILGILIVLGTTYGLAHALGYDGQLTDFLTRNYDSAAEWGSDQLTAIWNAISQ